VDAWHARTHCGIAEDDRRIALALLARRPVDALHTAGALSLVLEQLLDLGLLGVVRQAADLDGAGALREAEVRASVAGVDAGAHLALLEGHTHGLAADARIGKLCHGTLGIKHALHVDERQAAVRAVRVERDTHVADGVAERRQQSAHILEARGARQAGDVQLTVACVLVGAHLPACRVRHEHLQLVQLAQLPAMQLESSTS
jgi:hypothetical protein